MILQVGKLQVHSDFKELIVALRTAQVKGDAWDLDKTRSLNDDLMDALQMALIWYRKPINRAVSGDKPIMVSLRRDY